MRRVSKKRSRLQREVGPMRRDFVLNAGACWTCRKARATDCHEMASGSHRELALSERCTWLAVCTMCNCYRLTDKVEWPLVRQLAIKWINDAEYFNVEKFNLIRGRDRLAITWTEVVVQICHELDRWGYRNGNVYRA